MPDIFDLQRRPIHLGQVIGKGGEGAVYEVANDQNSVAKIYHRPLSNERAEKIRLMVGLNNKRIEGLAAWPKSLLFQKTGIPVGLLMPKISDHKDIHHLYSPKGRRTGFVKADWRFLVRAATNVARAFAVVHEAGCVIGDVNHGSVLVAEDMTVKLIDCDSFQVATNGRRFLCEVGVETFTPPELQERTFKGIVRTANHDNFGLAVMIFLLLFMGRHPFAGRFLGHGDMRIARAIRECRFPYGSRRAVAQMEPPPSTPPLLIAGDDVAFLFERAFAREMIPGGRPEAREWITALERLEKETRRCAANPSHWHLAALKRCPWCQMEGETGAVLFPVGIQPTGFDLTAIWREFDALPHPGPAPLIHAPTVQPSSAASALQGWDKRRKMIAACVAVAPFALLFSGMSIPIFWIIAACAALFFGVNKAADRSEEVASFGKALNDASATWTRVQTEWNTRAGHSAFQLKRQEVEQLRRELAQLPSMRMKKLDDLKSNQIALQLNEFLDRFELDRAKISGIGAGVKQVLSSYGVETAADMTDLQLSRVPSIGPSRRGKLIAWRELIKQRFRFDPTRAIDPSHVAKVEREILAERKRLEDRARASFVELKTISAQVIAARQHLRKQVEAACAAYTQATVNYNAAKS